MYLLRKLGESNSISSRQRLIQLIHDPAQLLPEELEALHVSAKNMQALARTVL